MIRLTAWHNEGKVKDGTEPCAGGHFFKPACQFNTTVIQAKEAALKAVELDDTLAEGHIELGTVYFTYDYDWPAAEREFRRGVELSPNYARAQELLGWYLVEVGRTGEGLDHARRPVALDPLSVESAGSLGWQLYFARRYDEAAAQTRKVFELQPECGFCDSTLGQIYAQRWLLLSVQSTNRSEMFASSDRLAT